MSPITYNSSLDLPHRYHHLIHLSTLLRRVRRGFAVQALHADQTLIVRDSE